MQHHPPRPSVVARRALIVTVPALAFLLLICGVCSAAASEPPPEEISRATAVALNYCRASFHRIKRTPSKRVLVEEQEKILNNLDLDPIADEEVVRLYTAVLEEISEVQIAEKERQIIRDRHHRAFVYQAAVSAVALGTQLATAHYDAAIRTGARSWWDYRTMRFQRELDTWQIEKDRMIAVVDKSSHFLDTFWKLARRRNIPDRWLIRSQNLDQLEDAMAEDDLEVRLRVLKRMERFMECYPPYWYYVARTQQGLGQLFAAAETYRILSDVGSGHFRDDEMLAAALANHAAIQQYLRQPSAPLTAERALTHSTDVWEVNLMCAGVLGQHGRFAEAEDAILRNLDVGLECDQSLQSLLWLYRVWGHRPKLTSQLSDPVVVSKLTAPILLECARSLGSAQMPRPAAAQLAASLYGEFDLHFGRDDFTIHTSDYWQLARAQIALQAGEKLYTPAQLKRTKGGALARFAKIAEVGRPLVPSGANVPLALLLEYPETAEIQIVLKQLPQGAAAELQAGADASGTKSLAASLFTIRKNTYQMVALRVGDTWVTLTRQDSSASIGDVASKCCADDVAAPASADVTEQAAESAPPAGTSIANESVPAAGLDANPRVSSTDNADVKPTGDTVPAPLERSVAESP